MFFNTIQKFTPASASVHVETLNPFVKNTLFRKNYHNVKRGGGTTKEAS
jgi:hypothetical protein